MAAATLALAGCSLDEYPHSSTTSNDVYASVDGYQAVLSGIYAAMVQRISAVSDEDRSQNYIRTMSCFQDGSTDAVDMIWLSGESLTDVNGLNWNASDAWCSAMWYHIYNIISMTNELIRNASADKISSFSSSEQATIQGYVNDARFLRAYAYWQAMDFYKEMTFVTEADAVGSFVPATATRSEVFDYVVSELSAIAEELPVTSYAHATRGAAYALLARVYLNAEVYTGTPHYSECVEACEKVFADGYTLEEDYAKIFNASNHLRNMGGSEIIFLLACDSSYITTWDATTYLCCDCVLSNLYDYQLLSGTLNSGAWNNLRARPELVDAFEDGDLRNTTIGIDRYAYSEWDSGLASSGYYLVDGDTDYYYYDREKNISMHDDTSTGYRICKWTNLTDDGECSSDAGVSGCDTDYVVLRLADVYLMYAEAALQGGGSVATGLEYVNAVRARAGLSAISSYDLDYLCTERLRELYLEGIRRTDLIRYDKYVSNYNWQWKAGVYAGASVAEKYKYLAIPEAEYSVNPALQTINNSLGY